MFQEQPSLNKEKDEQTEEALNAISVWDAEIDDYQQKIEVCKKKKSEVVAELMKVQPASFQFKEKWYILKTIRKTGTNTITKMDVPPGSWLKKKEEKNE